MSPGAMAFPDVSGVVAAQQLSVLFEASGYPKPGNVMRGMPFREIAYHDFVSAAVAIGEPLSRVYRLAQRRSRMHKPFTGLWGRALLDSCKAAMSGRSNAIFGTLLVEIPLGLGACVTATGSATEEAARIVLSSGPEDSIAFVRSIRLCRIGGLSHEAFVPGPEAFDLQDPLVEATIRRKKAGMVQVLGPSVGYDLLARELLSGFPITRRSAREYVHFLREMGDPTMASAAVFCSLLGEYPDSLIARNAGRRTAENVARRARKIMASDRFSAEWLRGMLGLDRALRRRDLNPGTLADLTAAAIFLALLGGID